MLMRSAWLLPVLGLYAAACGTPAIYFDEGGSACTAIRLGSPTGLEALLLGWVPPFTIPWSANIVLLLGFILFLQRKPRSAWYCGAAASLLGITTLLPSALAQVALILPLPPLNALPPLKGYFLWQGSLISFAVIAGAEAMVRRAPRTAPGTP